MCGHRSYGEFVQPFLVRERGWAVERVNPRQESTQLRNSLAPESAVAAVDGLSRGECGH